MLKFFLFLLLVIVLLLLVRPWREWLFEHLKDASDEMVMFLLRSTSRFGRELTQEGKAEQTMWRERRLRDLRGLAERPGLGASKQISDGRQKEDPLSLPGEIE